MILTSFLILIPIIGWIYLLYLLKKSFDSSVQTIKSLLPGALLSIFIYFPLFMEGYSSLILFSIYFIFSFFVVFYIKDKSINNKDFLFKTSLVFVSIPLILFLVGSLVNSISNLFNTNLVTRIGTKTVNVNSYMRSDSLVQAHTRNIATTMTSLKTTLSTEATLSMALIKATGENFKNNTSKANNETILDGNKSDVFIQQNTEISMSGISPIKENVLTENIFDEKLSLEFINNDFILENICPFITNKDKSFYRADNFNDKKAQKFISEFIVKSKKDNVHSKYLESYLYSDDYTPIAYFDETLFGSGENGILITKDWILSNIQFEKLIMIKCNKIKECIISGVLVKKITVRDENGNSYSIKLPQSNKGAQKISQTINNLILSYHEKFI